MAQFIVTNTEDSGAGSLREAIESANTQAGNDEIIFENSFSSSTITLTSGELTITDDVQIQGLGADNLAISGNNNSPVFVVDDGTDNLIEVSVTGLTITEGVDRETLTNGDVVTDAGAGIDNLEQLTLNDSTITGNDGTAIDNAGTLYLNNSTVENNYYAIQSRGTAVIVSSTIRNNSYTIFNGGTLTVEDTVVADNFGYGIRNSNSDNTAVVTVTNSTIENNQGGGIDNFSFTSRFDDEPSGDNLVIVKNSTIRGNSQGGGIYNRGSAVEVRNSTITGNVSQNGGGGINNRGGATLTIENSTVSNNVANSSFGSGYGGGISNRYDFNTAGGIPTLEVINSTISGNRASSGGGIFNNGGNLTISNSTVGNNITSSSSYNGGGAIYNSTYVYSYYSDRPEVKTAEIINTTITGNRASNGGGISNRGDLIITDSTLSGNTATYGGGGINNRGELTISNSTIANNSASYDGGGISNATEGNLEVIQSTIAGNSATNGGGIINNGYYNSGGNATIFNSTITDNLATESGSGIANNGNPIEVTSTIIAANEGDRDVFGNFTTNGNNLIGNGDGADGFTDGVNGDIVGTSENAIDPLLGTLQDNGGNTQTIVLDGSRAIDAGSNPLDLATDQRGEGFPRTLDGDGDSVAAIDIGAFEANADGNPPDGGSEGELIIGTNQRDSLVGGMGNDTIDGSLARDTLAGGAGNDELFGGRGKDLVFGDAGNDLIQGNGGGDTLNGGSGNDTLRGGNGKDVLVGGDGFDVLSGGDAADSFTLASGLGTDSIIDFQPRKDTLLLGEGLSFESLSAIASEDDTNIILNETDELIAVLVDTNVNSISEANFSA